MINLTDDSKCIDAATNHSNNGAKNKAETFQSVVAMSHVVETTDHVSQAKTCSSPLDQDYIDRFLSEIFLDAKELKE